MAASASGAARGGVIAGTIGHFAGGSNCKDMKELGEFLDIGEAALLAVAEDAIDSTFFFCTHFLHSLNAGKQWGLSPPR
jgi:hypothetical protein